MTRISSRALRSSKRYVAHAVVHANHGASEESRRPLTVLQQQNGHAMRGRWIANRPDAL